MTGPEDRVDALLSEWGTPEPRPGFAERVLARAEAEEAKRRPPARSGRSLLFGLALGTVLGAASVASMTMLRRGSRASEAPAFLHRTHLRAPGVADVVGEPGSELQWERRVDGDFVVEVVDGVAWVRHGTEGPRLHVIVDGDPVELGGACGRVEVTRGLLSVDVSVDDVECVRVEVEIEAASAELSRASAR